MEIQENQQETWSETESRSSTSSRRAGFSGPLATNKRNSSKKSSKYKEEEYVEITLDVRDDSVSVQNIRGGDSETAFLASQLERKNHPSLGSQLSLRLRQVSQELKRITSSNTFDKVDRSKSGAARALKGLKFMTKNVGTEGWSEVEARFDKLAVDGLLPKNRFGQCIGTLVIYIFKKNSKRKVKWEKFLINFLLKCVIRNE